MLADWEEDARDLGGHQGVCLMASPAPKADVAERVKRPMMPDKDPVPWGEGVSQMLPTAVFRVMMYSIFPIRHLNQFRRHPMMTPSAWPPGPTTLYN